jgi:hypothetical protein
MRRGAGAARRFSVDTFGRSSVRNAGGTGSDPARGAWRILRGHTKAVASWGERILGKSCVPLGSNKYYKSFARAPRSARYIPR